MATCGRGLSPANWPLKKAVVEEQQDPERNSFPVVLNNATAYDDKLLVP